jgi:glycosidase
MYEFHISRRARERYQFDESLFSLNGNVVIADFDAARRFADRMTEVRGEPVSASEINAMGIIDEILHLIVREYDRRNPGVIARALTHLEDTLGPIAVGKVLLRFTEEFPPLMVFRAEISAQDYLNRSTDGVSHRVIALEELLLLHVSTLNPALIRYNELFDVEPLRQTTPYESFVASMDKFFVAEPGLADSSETLLKALLAPALASPDSLQGQLEFLLKCWGAVLGESFVNRILRAVDFAREEAKYFMMLHGGKFESASPGVMEFHSYSEYEAFSQDKDWMPRLVLLAKNAYVWLDQLSKQYGRDIARLDQVPDEELDLLARRGFTGLWLIGLWERSNASKTIKQMMGQSDAVASAYSLYNYDIANDLGGWDALVNLKGRAAQRGIRLSADMVPNHMGIDSKWVIDHPDWFLSRDHSPYPAYSFNGSDLSSDQRVGIYLEDHYFSKSDAAVVFKRVDKWSGDTRYIYHGNDGTSFPWNDTAQLDYLNAEAREAVIQTILHVARNFSIIRFDAAMTLAKKHIQRLWFPEPGSGGAIPSRSEHGITRAEFDRRIPNEFWREVVDRVAAEVPDTLLLAEAFWLMEGYFVRTLGMHRVYNSAFMHMLRDEDNAKYRQVMKNVLEYDPRILQRFVNFMSNPDEKTAVEQFGKADKYFGVCVVMATLPGLPMIGHGQVEGYAEKYGMEYRRAKLDERPDEGFIRYHEQVIFPIFHRRFVFAGVENFLLYDFYSDDGAVNEDVFAYSNGCANGWGAEKRMSDRGLVIYHNRFADASGWVKTSSAFMQGDQLIQRSLADGLSIPRGDQDFAIFRDSMTGLEYIRSCKEINDKGLYVELGAYKCHVFVDWRFVSGDEWGMVNGVLNGAGVSFVQATYDEMFAVKVEAVEEKVVEEKVESGKKKVVRRKKATAKKSVVKKKVESGKSKKTVDRRPKAVVKKKEVAKKKVESGKKKAVVKKKEKPAAQKTRAKKSK